MCAWNQVSYCRPSGHMIYELSAGRVLQGEEPTASDFEFVKGSRGGIQDLLSLVFSLSAAVDSGARTYKDALQEVCVCMRVCVHVCVVCVRKQKVM